MDKHFGALLGLISGLVLGLAAAFGGIWAFLLVLVLGAVGLIIGRVVDGDLDLTYYLGARRGERSRR
ncbi:DUF2273 domain-containing protein [Nakamurella multipartita]|jgi:uncharacterized membrane protein|uniref:Small integral membrane protein n=1 Tax=Nakamurella multipartita (strain ATCC 700099 / DSM 44233 / CIP 104796 / JCM 9543 / NBRC 105858 / Y-104) TaxID=479431 RepID=C8XA69_NAKMY|nr:DUF2273 domain-containing protein [Nakamurella multipartita]ACV81269.1 hypothetical protein Namu_4996 [Nakamurella multipartita DSM 44233]HOZ58956.1 DUF2273 domain-containing protein [Nakamurella multipartita]